MNSTDRKRFRDNYYVDTETGCWLWTRAKFSGYGRFWSIEKRRSFFAHRASYEDAKGPIPDGLQIDHLCRVRHCVNPDHLEVVTIKENVLRGAGLTAESARKTHCKYGHELTPENVYRTPSRPNSRNCIKCRRKPVVKSHCRRGHEFTEANTVQWRDGRRDCKVCHDMNWKRRRSKQRK